MATRESMPLSPVFKLLFGTLLALSAWMLLDAFLVALILTNPFQPLPAGSHKPQPLIFFDNSIDMGVVSSTSLEAMFWRQGIDVVSIGYLETWSVGDDDGKIDCVIHVRYFYGRELCWDGRSESFEESFP